MILSQLEVSFELETKNLTFLPLTFKMVNIENWKG